MLKCFVLHNYTKMSAKVKCSKLFITHLQSNYTMGSYPTQLYVNSLCLVESFKVERARKLKDNETSIEKCQKIRRILRIKQKLCTLNTECLVKISREAWKFTG